MKTSIEILLKSGETLDCFIESEGTLLEKLESISLSLSSSERVSFKSEDGLRLVTSADVSAIRIEEPTV